MQDTQTTIARSLSVVPPFAGAGDTEAEIRRRTTFIRQTLLHSGLKTLVLGISGGVDSLLAGRLAQLAVEGLRDTTGDDAYRFIAVRLPAGTQFDEADARDALAFVRADEERRIDIAASTAGLVAQFDDWSALPAPHRDHILGNIKARLRMVAQYAIANATGGLVIGTDHAAEAVMGFFTKFGDGACDLAPLHGLVKGQVRAMAARLGAPPHLVAKIPTADLEELSPGRPDEEAYGVTYDQIDAFLHGQPLAPRARERIVNAFEASRHKRETPRVP